MGRYLHTYLGPYVECHYRSATRVTLVRGCTRPECPEYKNRDSDKPSWKFCPECGTGVGESGKTIDVRPGRYEVVGDALYEMEEGNDSRLLLAPNVRREGEPSRHTPRDGNDEGHFDLTKVDRVAEMDWFERAFANEIGALLDAYDNVTVKWGFHQFYL